MLDLKNDCSPDIANIEQLIDLTIQVIEDNEELKKKIVFLESKIGKMVDVTEKNFSIKESAKILRTGENVIRNLVKDGKIRAMKMPTMIIPDFELERFRNTILETQEDLTLYANKNFNKESARNNVFDIGG